MDKFFVLWIRYHTPPIPLTQGVLIYIHTTTIQQSYYNHTTIENDTLNYAQNDTRLVPFSMFYLFIISNMRRCNIITDKEWKEMFVKDAELVVFKLLPPLEYIIQKWYHTAWYPTVNNIMQDYNEAVNYDENASQNSMWRSYYQSCVRDIYRYLRYYVEKEWVTTWDVYVWSNNIEGNNLSIWYDEWYTHHRTYANNWKLDNVIYKLRDEEWTVEDALKKHRKKNEEAKWYEMKEIDADFVRQHLDPKLYIDVCMRALARARLTEKQVSLAAADDDRGVEKQGAAGCRREGVE